MTNIIRTRPGRIIEVDGLRGIAALMVVMVHAGVIWGPPEKRDFLGKSIGFIVETGLFNTGVDIFFVISGFVIFLSLSESKILTIRQLFYYLVRRSIRLDPPFWVALMGMWILLVIQHRFGSMNLYLPSISEIFLNATYTYGIFGQKSILVVAWTLCLEFQWYFLVCSCFFIYQQFRSRFMPMSLMPDSVGVAMILSGISLFSPLITYSSESIWIVSRLPTFMMGVWVAILTLKASSNRLVILMVTVCVFASYKLPILSLLASVATALLIIIAVFHPQGIPLLRMRFLQTVGQTSYSLYLVHVPIIFIFGALVTRLGLVNGSLSHLVAIIVGVIIALATWCFFVFIERPTLIWSSSLKKKWGI